MKKQDILTSVVIVAGVGLTFLGMASSGTSISIFYDPASIEIIVANNSEKNGVLDRRVYILIIASEKGGGSTK